jgi:hypothetical protein
MMKVEETHHDDRYFVSYSGVKLPFNLVDPIATEALSNRNTFIRAFFDRTGCLIGFDKLVYGEVELAHRYEYHANGALRRAEITMLDEESVVLFFDVDGERIPGCDIPQASLA